MQIYTDSHGVQQYTDGSISIDSDTGLPVLPVIWTGEFDIAKVGGYSVVEGELVYSQAAFDENEALKVTVAAAQAAALVTATRQLAKDAIDGTTPDGIILRSLVLLLIDELNDLRTELRAIKTRGSAATNSQASIRGIFTPMGNLPDRTGQQAIGAMKTKITDGLAG